MRFKALSTMMHVKTKFYAITVIKIIVYDLLYISKTYKKDFFH
jgi:hypothetical protein